MKRQMFAVACVSLAVVSCGGGSPSTSPSPQDASQASPDAVEIIPDTAHPSDMAGIMSVDSQDMVPTMPDVLGHSPDVVAPVDAWPSADLSVTASPDGSDVTRLPTDVLLQTTDGAGPADAIVALRDAIDAGIADVSPDGPSNNALPRFVDTPDAGSASPFLISLAHLYGSTVAGVPLHPIRDVSVINPGTGPADVIVTSQLQKYSVPATVGLHVSANSTASTGPIDLTFDFDALYGVSAPVTANASLQLTASGSTALLDAHTRSIQLLPKNTIYWSMSGSDGSPVNTTPFIGVFVTPHDKAKAIDQLLKESASFSRCNAMVGYQTPDCLNATVTWSPSTGATPPGYCSTWPIQATAGTVFDISVQTSCASLCTSSNATFQIFTQSDWQGSRASALGTISNLGSWTGHFIVPSDDTYVLAACNPSSNFADRSFTVTATGNPISTGVIDQMSAIFNALKKRGMQYVNVPQDFFVGAQNVKFPVESLATESANCIDGTLVFASALESMQMRPGIVAVDGHAFVAVLAGASTDPCKVANWIPIETTRVSSKTAVEAVKEDLVNHMPAVTQVYSKDCAIDPSQSINTIYDLAFLRSLGILPAPM